jgi:tRNA threonylcarbamoyl adenosine modification protein YjeE
LGAGKTLFAKGLAQGLGVAPEAVTSPTFAICTEYELADGRRIAHLDGYRLENAAELEGVGFLDLLVAGTIILFEWGERFRDALPADRLEIEISRSDATPSQQRRLEAVASGRTAARALAGWEARLAGEIGRQLDLELPEPLEVSEPSEVPKEKGR